MLQHGLAPDRIFQYLIATRGPGSEYVRNDGGDLLRFWGDCLESLENSGVSTSHIKLTLVDSILGDIETVKYSAQSHIVFDLGLTDIFSLLTSVGFSKMTKALGVSWLDLGAVPWWEHALFSHRFLVGGFRSEALVQAQLCNQARSQQAPLAIDEKRRDRWVRVQSSFAIAHEIAHCNVFDGEQILARGIAQSFEDNVRGYVEEIDAASPASSQPSAWYQLMKRRQSALHDALKRAFPDAVVPEGTSPFRWLSAMEKLDWILSDEAGIGEEIMADHFSLSMTARLQSNENMSFDECLLASVATVRQMFLVRSISAVCQSYSASSQQSDENERLFKELDLRHTFAQISAVVLAQKDFFRTNDSSIPERNVLHDMRMTRLVEALNESQKIWDVLSAETFGRFHATATQRAIDGLGDERGEFDDSAESDQLESIISHVTGIHDR